MDGDAFLAGTRLVVRMKPPLYLDDIQNRIAQIERELEEIDKDRRGSFLSEEEMQTLKRIYSSLKSKLEQKTRV